jgi:hypothetical protein
MGTKAAPTIANIFMAEIDEKIKKCGNINNKNLVHFYKRYIDDIFIIWTGTRDEFTKFTETTSIKQSNSQMSMITTKDLQLFGI